MNASTIVAVVRQMITDGATDAAIVAVLAAMGINTDTSTQSEAETSDPNADRRAALQAELEALDNGGALTVSASNGHAKPQALRGGAAPTVKYQMIGQWTPKRLSERLTGRKLQVASLVLAHNKTGITKREILAKLQADDASVTNGAVMSALAPLGSVMQIIKSIPIPGAVARIPAKPAATGRGAKVR